MFRLVPRTSREDRMAYVDRVVLADGQVMVVPRANLAAAKALLAAQKAAQRRVAARATAIRAWEVEQESLRRA
jgi:hypothetical protein